MNADRFSPIALALLALLYEAPMHPYRMQQLIKSRGKGEVINVRQRASLYQTIDRLLRAKLIAVRATAREEHRPERTIYEITDRGRSTLIGWMHEALSTPAREYPAFPAILAYLALLTPGDARVHLERRAQLLAAEVERIDGELHGAQAAVPRLFLIELEYLRTMLATELTWVQALVQELGSGQLTWNEEWQRDVVERLERDPERPQE
jgi:DNA-binding PadR family transcriptional regulator